MSYLIYSLIFFLTTITFQSQSIYDNFEGDGNISTWFGDDCVLQTNFSNPFQTGINRSNTVLKYEDSGGQYANIRFDTAQNLDLTTYNAFKLRIYIPSDGLSGNQPNQISLKLQNGGLAAPWSTQSEIIKPIILDQWQEITFDFDNDSYINLDSNSLPPIQRTDFNRVVIQINGENNNDSVTAYIDDISNLSVANDDPVFDQLVWADEFDGTGSINTTKWYHQTLLPNGTSWYNGEIQHYTDRVDNSFVSGGYLNIVAKRETFTDQGVTKQYTSARLNSKFAFTYGKVEIRAKLPYGVGTWPALWTLGKNINEDGGYWDEQGFGTENWPDCGEIDIMEHWGTNQNYVQSAIHTPSSYGGTVNIGGQTIPTASTEFHIYTMEWSPEKMTFSVDGVQHYTYNPPVKDASTWPFDQDQYLLMNVAILPEIQSETFFTETSLQIDYVRVYQESSLSSPEFANTQKVTFYPNPVNNELNITLNYPVNQNIKIEILDVNGRLVFSKTSKVLDGYIKLNTSALKSGMFFVRLLIENNLTTHKLIKH